VQYLLTKPLHWSQRKVREESDGAVVFAYQLTWNTELENLLLSFGEWVEVLAPEDLRQQIAGRVRQQYRRYWPEEKAGQQSR